MKIIIIILFLILIILSTTIKLDIEKLEITNSKIKYKAKIKIYIFKYIKIFQKRIRKKDLKKITKYIGNKKIRNNKTIKRIKPKITQISANIDYGIKDIFINIYLYAAINSIIPMLIAKNRVAEKNRDYTIQTNFSSNYFKAKLKLEMEIKVRDAVLINKL